MEDIKIFSVEEVWFENLKEKILANKENVKSKFKSERLNKIYKEGRMSNLLVGKIITDVHYKYVCDLWENIKERYQKRNDLDFSGHDKRKYEEITKELELVEITEKLKKDYSDVFEEYERLENLYKMVKEKEKEIAECEIKVKDFLKGVVVSTDHQFIEELEKLGYFKNKRR